MGEWCTAGSSMRGRNGALQEVGMHGIECHDYSDLNSDEPLQCTTVGNPPTGQVLRDRNGRKTVVWQIIVVGRRSGRLLRILRTKALCPSSFLSFWGT